MDFPATIGAFDTVFNGDPSIFWGDAFVTKLVARPDDIDAARAAARPGRADAAVAVQRRHAAAADHVRLERRRRRGVVQIQIDDSSAFTAPLVRDADRHDVDVRDRPGCRPRPQFWRVRGVNSAGVPPAPGRRCAASRRRRLRRRDARRRTSTSIRRPSSAVTRSSGTVVLSVGAPDGGAVVALSSSNPAVAAVPASVTVPADGFTGTFTIATSPVAASTTVVDHRHLQRHDEDRDADGHAAGAPTRRRRRCRAWSVSPASVTGGAGAQGTVTLVGRRAGGRRDGLALEQQPGRRVRAGERDRCRPERRRRRSPSRRAPSSASTTVTITATYDGTTRTATLTVTPAPPPPQTATLTVTASGRGGERVTLEPGRHQCRHRQQRLGVVHRRHVDHAERRPTAAPRSGRAPARAAAAR